MENTASETGSLQGLVNKEGSQWGKWCDHYYLGFTGTKPNTKVA